MGRAARELELKTGEFELAVQLDEVSTVPPGPGAAPGRRRVPASEVARLQGERGFPDALRERIRVVGATEGAELMGIAPGRFLRLARAGCFGPVRFYVNRYGAIVWQYLAAELSAFAGKECGLIHGPTPPPMRAMLSSGQDWRGRLWRSRRVAQLVTDADGAWAVSAAIAAVLPPEELASLVRDPAERVWLRKLRPCLSSAGANTTRSREAVERVETAEEFDEVMWYRISLSRQLDAARLEHPAPAMRLSGARAGAEGAAAPADATDSADGSGSVEPGELAQTGANFAVGKEFADTGSPVKTKAFAAARVPANAKAPTKVKAPVGTDGSAEAEAEAEARAQAPAVSGDTRGLPAPAAVPSPRARLIRARTGPGAATASRARPRAAATGGGTARPGAFLTRRARASAGRARPQSPSFRKSPSWTTDTSSLPSRS
ncbi:hypothetical protein GCM10010361_69290 [Streptomyces olivaceiscleroticus]|uniref:Uncharacterized protein n=2 Tax=Streptomyces olivaceiscleroticus TaxID=68245 RepID=A0ABP3LAD9_9ACTN